MFISLTRHDFDKIIINLEDSLLSITNFLIRIKNYNSTIAYPTTI